MKKSSVQSLDAIGYRQVSRAALPLRNAIYGNRLPLEIELDDLTATLAFDGSLDEYGYDNTKTIRIRFGTDTASLSIDQALFDFVIERFDQKLAASRPSSVHGALAFEALLAATLEKAEKVLGYPITVVATEEGPPAVSDELSFTFRLVVEGFGSSEGVLLVAPPAAKRLTEALAKAPRGLIGAQDIRFPVVACLAATHISADEAKNLGLGDVILVEHICDSPTKPFVIVADQLVFPAVYGTRGLRIEGPASRASGSPQEWCMEQVKETVNDDAILDEDVAQLPVKLTFELGRVELTLAEVQELGQGAVIPLEKPMDQALDIMANGRRIGRGMIVKIGESIGVEVTRISRGQ